MRLNKFLAERLGISRRDADNLIDSGRVKVDGVIAKLGMQVLEAQDILVDNKKVDFPHQYTYLMLQEGNKVVPPLSTNYYPRRGKL